ncbi:MAG: hypothetical protein B6242_07335 [Anaerolineaceae bacterium 4572_78]|nr:MAG: hypothetical protein B6242_07335 [Anaerolineaceae bacterium 4572_78]
MEYRRLGKSGLQVSALSFGSWVTFGSQLDVEKGKQCMVAAHDAGVNFFDNAEVYAHGESEIIMGKVLKEMGWKRDTYILSSKVFWGGGTNPKPTQLGLSRKHVTEACHQALKRLQVDYLDLYFCEWSAQQIMEAYSVARQYNLIPPTMEQPQYNMLHRQVFEVEYARLYSGGGICSLV